MPELEAPDLARATRGAAGAVFLVPAAVGSVVRTTDVVLGHSAALATVLFQLAFLAVYLPLAALASTEWGRERASGLAGVSGIVACTDIAGWGILHGPTNPMFPYIALVPLVLTSTAPFKPWTSLVIGAYGAVVSLLVGSFVYQLPIFELEVRAALCLACGTVAAVSSQGRRRTLLQKSRSDARARLVASDRVANMGRLSGVLAHELKTPLATALNEMAAVGTLVLEMEESIEHPDVTPYDMRKICGEAAKTVGHARDAAERAVKVVRAFQASTRPAAPGSGSRFLIGERVQLVTVLLKHQLRAHGVRVETENLGREVYGNVVHFDQILTNVIRNAVDAIEFSGRGSTIWVRADSARGGTLLSMEDDGPGIPPEVASRIFDHGFSTKHADHGLGIGLWLCRNLAEGSFGGTLDLAAPRRTAHGARFEWWLPSADRASADTRDAELASSGVSRRLAA